MLATIAAKIANSVVDKLNKILNGINSYANVTLKKRHKNAMKGRAIEKNVIRTIANCGIYSVLLLHFFRLGCWVILTRTVYTFTTGNFWGHDLLGRR